MATIEAWVAPAAKSSLVRQKVELGPLGDEEVEVEVEHCGLCHSDLSIRNNDWGFSQFPAVLGHEAVGRVVEVGRAAKGLTVGQRVGVGWTAGSCMHCRQCMSGNHHLCPQSTFTIVGHKGAFASRVRAHWGWAVPLPEKINVAEAGPLLCGGMTVFNPLAMYAKPTRGRPNSRVTSRHLGQSSGIRASMSSSKRPYGFTCSQISGVSALRSRGSSFCLQCGCASTCWSMSVLT